MTPTPEQLAAVLPRCAAGLDGGDWTEDDDRLAWATKVLHYVDVAMAANEPVTLDFICTMTDDCENWTRMKVFEPDGRWSGRAACDEHMPNELQHCDSALCGPESDETPSGGPEGPRNETRTYSGPEFPLARDPHEVLDGDRWEIRNGRAVIVGSNDWPGPAGEPMPDAVCPTCPMLDDVVSSHEAIARLRAIADRRSRTPDPQEAK